MVLEMFESTCPAEYLLYFIIFVSIHSGVCIVVVEWVVSMGLSSFARWVALTLMDWGDVLNFELV